MGTRSFHSRFLLVAVLLIPLGGTVGISAAWWYEARRPLREAILAYNSGDYALSLRWANWHLRRMKYDLTALRLVARSHARLGDYGRAVEIYQQIPKMEAEDYLLLGMSHAKLKEYHKAIDPLRKAVELRPTSEGRRFLAVVYNELDRPEHAVELAQLVAEDPVEGDLGLALLGELYFARDLPRPSYDAYAKLLYRNPELKGVPLSRHGILLNQIDSLLKLAEPDQAAELLRELGDLTQDARALVLRGKVRHQQGDVAGAESDWIRAIELDPGQTRCLIDLGLLCFEQNRLEHAIEWLNKAAEVHHSDPALQQHLAIAHNRIGNEAAAAEHQQLARRLRDQMEQRQIRARTGQTSESPH